MAGLTQRLGLGLALGGSVAVLFAGLLIDVPHGGWILIASAAGIAGSAAWVGRGYPGAAAFPVAVCVLSSVPIVETTALVSAPAWGLGVWMMPLGIAAVGLVAALIGSFLLAWRPRSSKTDSVDGAAGRPCPGCKRQVPVASALCGYCGFPVKRYRARLRQAAQGRKRSPSGRP